MSAHETPGRVLVVDDERNLTFVVQAVLERAGYEVLVRNDGGDALEALEAAEADDEGGFDAVVTDLMMPGIGGMDILAHCQKRRPDLPVVLITAFGTVESAVTALKAGAFDYVTKPFEQSELLNVVTKAVATHRQRLKEPIPIAVSPAAGESNATFSSLAGIVGASPQMQDVFKVIAKIAASPTTVLLTGESGTGKELVALEIHRGSPRAKNAFIKIKCAAIPATLIESELFGYERGAFTGAVGSKPGRFELADKGTIFLDEIAEMPIEMQVKLLRAIQEQEFERVGGVHTVRVDTRIIAATNRDLEAEVKAGRFRSDLFYRLNVVPIHLPALRERREDIDALVRIFIQQFNERLGKRITGVEPACMAALRGHAWPGNIRQLENAIERMVLMADGATLTVEDLPDDLASAAGVTREARVAGESAGFKDLVKRQTQHFERDLIEKALEETGGNVTRAAEKLGLSRKGLQLKIKEVGARPKARTPTR